jgi:hypothetical protein
MYTDLYRGRWFDLVYYFSFIAFVNIRPSGLLVVSSNVRAVSVFVHSLHAFIQRVPCDFFQFKVALRLKLLCCRAGRAFLNHTPIPFDFVHLLVAFSVCFLYGQKETLSHCSCLLAVLLAVYLVEPNAF